MVLARALPHANEQGIILVHQRADQRLIISGQQGNHFVRTVASRSLPCKSCMRPARGIPSAGRVRAFESPTPWLFTEADRLEDFVRSALDDLLLLAVEQGEHFAILFQFFAQSADQGDDAVYHESMLFGFRLGYGQRRGLGRGGAGIG